MRGEEKGERKGEDMQGYERRGEGRRGEKGGEGCEEKRANELTAGDPPTSATLCCYMASGTGAGHAPRAVPPARRGREDERTP
eukprot:768681-Hanusia_phi.AAC.3